MVRYQEIHKVIRKRIFDGEYPVNSNLPSEAELCHEFGASRFTVREALKRLQKDGLAERKQGACGKVIRSKPSVGFIQSFETTKELLRFARDSGYEHLSSERVSLDASLSEKLNLQNNDIAPSDWLLQRGLRLNGADGTPIALIETYIAPEFESIWEEIRHRKPPFFIFIEESTGVVITDIEQEIQALTMPIEVQQLLKDPPTDISLRILRRYKSAQKLVLASFNWHLGEDNFIFSSSLKQKDRS